MCSSTSRWVAAAVMTLTVAACGDGNGTIPTATAPTPMVATAPTPTPPPGSTFALFGVVSEMTANGIVPVVGDVSGPKAMRAIAADMSARKLHLSAFYISNVEYYLFRGRTFGAYAENVKQLPNGERSMVIRSVFPSGGVGRPAQSVPGYYSSSIVQSFPKMLEDIEAGRYRSYLELIVASSR